MGALRRAMIPALAPFARRLWAGRARIAMFHRLAPDPTHRRVSVQSFEWRIKYLLRHYRVTPLSELVRRIRSGEPLDNRIALTFDDGHRDFLECAYPVLSKYRAPATVYLVSDFIAQRSWLWSDLIHWMTFAAAPGCYRLRLGSDEIESSIDSFESRSAMWERVADYCLGLTAQVRHKELETFAAELGVRPPELPVADYAAMSWDDVRSLDPELIEVGAHTRTHPILSTCTRDEQVDEIEGCRTAIESALQRPISAFCYPNGRATDINTDTLAILRGSAYTSAVASFGGLITKHTDPYLLPRIGAGDEEDEFRVHMDGLAFGAQRWRSWRSRLLARG